MKLFFHAGLHKTGSTSVQIFLNCQPSQLAKSGFFYPSDWNINGAHHALKTPLVNGDIANISKVFRRWRDYCANHDLKNIVISSEDFEYIGQSGVASLMQAASEADLEPVSILYFRPQVDLIESQYSQHLREGLDPGSFDEFIHNSLKHGRYLRVLDISNWYDGLLRHNSILRFYYDDSFCAVNILEDFCKTLKIANPRNSSGYNFNKKLNSAQLEVIRVVCKDSRLLGMPRESVSRCLYSLIKKINWPAEIAAADPYMLNQGQIHLVAKHFEEENRILSLKLGKKSNFIEKWYVNKLKSSPIETALAPNSDLIQSFADDAKKLLEV